MAELPKIEGKIIFNKSKDMINLKLLYFVTLPLKNMNSESDEAPKKRKIIRLKGHDYSQKGFYFITICVKDKKCLFGRISNNEMQLNDLGLIAKENWMQIPVHYPKVLLHEYVIMPNHIHGIIELIDKHIENRQINKFSKSISGSISTIVQQYKTSITRWCNKNNQDFEWQTKFYDHIVRDKDSYHFIANYIVHNPAHWAADSLFSN